MNHEYKNIIILKGTVSAVNADMSKTVVTLDVRTGRERMFGGIGDTGAYTPKIVFYTPDIGRLGVGREQVRIRTHVHTYYRTVNKQTIRIDEIVGDTIEKAERFLSYFEGDVKNTGYCGKDDDENRAIFKGVIAEDHKNRKSVYVTPNGKAVIVTIKIEDEKDKSKTNICQVVCLGKSDRGGNVPFANIAQTLKPGDWVCFGGMVTTRDDPERGFSQSIVCRDIILDNEE